jgi:signal transduction histidine kinase
MLSGKELSGWERILIKFFYLLAVLLSIPWLFLKPTTLEARGHLGYVDVAIRGTLILSVGMSLWIAIRDYRAIKVPGSRRQLRLVVFGTVLGFPPFLLLSLLPETLRMSHFVPYADTFPFLLLGPALFLYSVYRYRLLWLERIALRAVAFYLLIIELTSLEVYLANILIRWNITYDPATMVWIWMVSLAAASILIIPSWKGFNRLSYWALYGNRNRFPGWLERTGVALSKAMDADAFCRVVYRDLSELLPVPNWAIFLKDRVGRYYLADAKGLDPKILAGCCLHEDGPLATNLAKVTGVLETPQLLRLLKRKGITIRSEEMGFILSKDIDLWLPLISDGKLQGLVVFGPSQQDRYLTSEERRLLQSFVFQGGLPLNKLYLDQEVLQRQRELDQAHRKLFFAREEERKRLARELHDQVIQPLLVHHFTMSKLNRGIGGDAPDAVATLQKEVSAIIQTIRNLCAELRPPVLDNLGLEGALQSLVDDFKCRNHISIRFLVEGDPVVAVSDQIELCVYRVLQEALVNVQKHAAAHGVDVGLRIAPTEIDLIVEDDGRGFIIPSGLDQLTLQHQYGLAGLTERAELVGGSLEISSSPGHGCQILLQIPLGARELCESA